MDNEAPVGIAHSIHDLSHELNPGVDREAVPVAERVDGSARYVFHHKIMSIQITDALIQQPDDIGMFDRRQQNPLTKGILDCSMEELDGNTLRESFAPLTKIDGAVAASAKPFNQAEGSKIGRKKRMQLIPERHQ
jgi:hypothetical protein